MKKAQHVTLSTPQGMLGSDYYVKARIMRMRSYRCMLIPQEMFSHYVIIVFPIKTFWENAQTPVRFFENNTLASVFCENPTWLYEKPR